jgi:hypothetical protein
LEPTVELAQLIEDVHKTKSIKTLRKLQRDFGQLFCQQLTLGARLLSTKFLTQTDEASTAEQKEQFKISVGVSVSTPFGSGSVKHEQEHGQSTASAQSQSNQREENVFEAVGGDTILANNPPAWTTTVGHPENWRVINREGLIPIVEMIAQMPEYSAVQTWFIQAVPALNDYFTLDDTHSTIVRFRVQSPTNSLMVSNQRGNTAHYLGFRENQTSTPCQNTIHTMTKKEDFWIRIDSQISKTLFELKTFRAPVLRGFANYNIGGVQFGANYNGDFASVTWNIIAPFSEAVSYSIQIAPVGVTIELSSVVPFFLQLRQGSRVILQKTPFTDPNKKLTPDSNILQTSHMVVFRNAQGQFLPGMSDRDEYQYWRIRKVGGSVREGEPIKKGDSVRLCWCFRDQDTGYRDYAEDVFGRRRNLKPADMEQDILFLKIPWPRFESQGVPTCMILSGDASTQQSLMDVVSTQGTFRYVMQDLVLRIDEVPNQGHGDADDCKSTICILSRD